jgi:hypothetical protein
VSTEYLGRATGGADVLTVGNAPLYWGRQVVWERTAIQTGAPLTAAAKSLAPYLEIDAALVPGIVGNDRLVVDDGLGNQEYLQVTMVQTVDDKTGADLGDRDRLWVTPATRFAHPAGATVQEVTLSARREGSAYSVSDAATGELTLVAGGFTAGNPVVVSYRTHGRFGFRRSPGDMLQAVFPPAGADTDDIGPRQGDWKGLALLDGTTPSAPGPAATSACSRSASRAERQGGTTSAPTTTYRAIRRRRPQFPGAATAIAERDLIDPGLTTCRRSTPTARAPRHRPARATTSRLRGRPEGALLLLVHRLRPACRWTRALHKVHRAGASAVGYQVIGVFSACPTR